MDVDEQAKKIKDWAGDTQKKKGSSSIQTRNGLMMSQRASLSDRRSLESVTVRVASLRETQRRTER